MSISPKEFNLILVDPKSELCEAWKKYFSEYSEVQIVNGYFEKIKKFDCMVSAANSYGLMDGGVDLAIRNFFGMKVQYNVQKQIKKDFYGEQPVGTSIIVYTENEEYPFIAHTPTMRVPTDISKTTNVYEAMFAMLRAIANYNKIVMDKDLRINKVVCPGLGTAAGRMIPMEAARQMAVAYKNFKQPPTNLVWSKLFNKNFEIEGIK